MTANTLVVNYDTVREITATLGEFVRQANGTVEVLIRIETPVIGLTKWHFRLVDEGVEGATCVFYGEGRDYQLIVRNTTGDFTLEVVKPVCKGNGVMVAITVAVD